MSTKTLKILVYVCIIGLFLWVPALSAEETQLVMNSQLEPVVQEIYAEIMSPFCPGRALKDCPSEAAEELRQSIRKQIYAGSSKSQVEGNLIEEYGELILSVPRFSGFGAVAWLGPLAFLLLGGVVLGVWVKSLRPKK